MGEERREEEKMGWRGELEEERRWRRGEVSWGGGELSGRKDKGGEYKLD